MTSETQFAALPVRQRGTIEILDTAFKLYRRYFGVLMAWSALVALCGLVGTIIPFASLMAYPLVYGAGACSIAAAVRGQRISFGQVWDFTKPRYGALIGLILLAGLLLLLGLMALTMVMGIVGFGSVWLLQAIGAPEALNVILGIVGLVVVLAAGSVGSVLIYAWLSMVPLIACLEDDKRGPAAMGRAWDLIKGHWLRVAGLATLLTIAITVVMGIVTGSMALFGQTAGIFTDVPDESAILQFALTFTGFSSLFFLFWNPIQTLIIAVLYLDLRVRKEALDLEWTSYSTAPPPSLQTPATQTPAFETTPEAAPNAAYLPGDANRAAAPDISPTFADTAPRPPAPIFSESAPATTPPPRPPASASLNLDKSTAPTPPQSSPPLSSPPPPLSPPPQSPSFAPEIESPSSFGAGAEERDARA